MFEGQLKHALLLAALLAGLVASRSLEGVDAGELLGLGAWSWMWIGAGVVVAHQVYVAVAWRLELHGRRLTRTFGSRVFEPYAALFFVLFSARWVVLLALAAANRGSLPLASGVARGLAVVLALPALYTGYSVTRYFGHRRAAGLDHFVDDPRSLGIVRGGIFRTTRNAMYTYAFLGTWAIALWFGSLGALVLAAFSHAYIWVHYLCTERPDMRRLYGPEA